MLGDLDDLQPSWTAASTAWYAAVRVGFNSFFSCATSLRVQSFPLLAGFAAPVINFDDLMPGSSGLTLYVAGDTDDEEDEAWEQALRLVLEQDGPQRHGRGPSLHLENRRRRRTGRFGRSASGCGLSAAAPRA